MLDFVRNMSKSAIKEILCYGFEQTLESSIP